MSQDDVLFGYRLQLFDLAGRLGVAAACRTFGVHRSTYYRWKAQVDRHGLEVLRPRERRRPKMPNQLSPLVEERIVAFALGQPGLGPKRIASELRRPRWGGIVVSANGVWRCPAPARPLDARQALLADRRLPRSVSPGSVRSGSPPSFAVRAGAASSSPRTASGAACAGTASRRAPSAAR